MASASQFGPIALVLLAGLGLAVVLMLLSFVLGPRSDSVQKLKPYECGLEPLQEGRKRYSIHFYMVALLFIVFDIEIIFLFLWALVLRQFGVYALVEMLIFFAILLLAYVYVIRNGIFNFSLESAES